MELFVIILLLIGISIIIRGLFFCFINKNNILSIGGLRFYSELSIHLIYFIFLVFIFFYSLFFANLKLGFLNPNFNFNGKLLFIEAIHVMVVSFFEELTFRLLFFVGLLDLIKNRYHILIFSSLLFSAMHFPSNMIQIVSYFLAGLIYGYSFLKFQTIWIPISIHFAWNFIQGSIFGFSVSGNKPSSLFDLNSSQSVIWNGEPHGPEGSFAGLFLRIFLLYSIYLYKHQKTNSRFLNIYK